MSRILITGSEGSLAQAVLNKLLYNYELFGIDNLYKGQTPSKKANREYKFYQADLTDNIRTFEIFNEIKPHYVIQCAAHIYGVGGFNAHCADILGQDIQIHSNVLNACIKNKVKRIIFISSSMVYENCEAVPVEEFAPDNVPPPRTDYGLSKYVNERLTQSFQKQYGLDYTIWRPFNIITPYESAHGQEIGVSHVFADFLERIIVDKVTLLPIIGDGNQVRCFTWIGDVSDAIIKFSFDDRTKNDVFNIGNKEPITMINLAKKIFDLSQKMYYTHDSDVELKFIRMKDYPNDVKYRVPETLKMKTKLGWVAKTKLDESIKKCIEHKLITMKW